MDALRENQVFVEFESQDSYGPELPISKSQELPADEALRIASKTIEPKTRGSSLAWKVCNQIWHALFGAALVRQIGPGQQTELIRNYEHELNMRSYHWRI
ncbi:MAG: hypothetical protein IPK68_03500 [Bdellovibrionales bacterium]|nr:hypothetical protein [Bdellovibrionales bacterium]